MYDFAYHRPKTLAEATAALKGKPEARAMSGGMTLIPTLKQRLAKPSDVVDLNGIKDLAGIKVDGAGVTIGGMTRHADVASSADVRHVARAAASHAPVSCPKARSGGDGDGCSTPARARWPRIARTASPSMSAASCPSSSIATS